MKWFVFGHLQPHHPFQPLRIKNRVCDFENSGEFNGPGAHSFALKKIGEEVTEYRPFPFQSLPFFPFLQKMCLNFHQSFPEKKKEFLQKTERETLKFLKENPHDIFFTREIWDFSLEFLQELESLTRFRVVWLSSSPGFCPFRNVDEELKSFTHIYLIDQNGVDRLKSLGLNAFVIDFALADFPFCIKKRKKKKSLGFLGTIYPDRMKILSVLPQFDFSFYASGFGDDTKIMYPNLAPFFKKEVWGEKLLEEMAGFSAIWNPVHRSYMQNKEDNVTNFRLFEAAGCECFQFVEDKQRIRELFEEGEMAFYRNREELLEKLDFWLKNPDKMQKAATKVLDKVLDSHLYSHRMKKILSHF